MRPHVSLQGTLSCKIRVALFAFEGLLTSVRPHMNLEKTVGRKLSIALFVFKGLLAGVDSHVYNEIRLLQEVFVAFIALVVPLFSVLPCLTMQFLLHVLLAIVLTLKSKRILHRRCKTSVFRIRCWNRC